MKSYVLIICLGLYEIIVCSLLHEEYTKRITTSRFSTEHADQLSFIRDIEYTGRIIVNTTRREGFVERFCLNHTGYIFRRRVRLDD